MVKIKVIHDKDICIGCGACVATDEKNWEMIEDDSGFKAKLKDSEKEDGSYVKELDEMGDLMDSAEVCPVNCIHIEEDGKRKI